MNFKDVADKFALIEDACEGVVVPDREIFDVLDRLRRGEIADRRKLQRHTASVSKAELKRLISSGAVKCYDGVNVLEDGGRYNKDVGIAAENLDRST